ELEVDAGEAHVRDLIDLLEALHDELADALRRPLAVAAVLYELLDSVDDGLELGGRDGPPFAGAKDAGHDLLPVERLAATVLFDDHVGHFVDALVARESPLALEA